MHMFHVNILAQNLGTPWGHLQGFLGLTCVRVPYPHRMGTGFTSGAGQFDLGTLTSTPDASSCCPRPSVPLMTASSA